MAPDPADGSASPRIGRYLLGTILVVSLLLRLAPLRESLWVDELHTAWCVSGSLAEVAPRAAAGNQSPVFFWLEWLLARLMGPGEVALRLPSLIAGALLPLALYAVAIRWTKSLLVALVAAALAAVDPQAIFYATEARPYALVELLAVIHVALFVELIANPTPRRRVAFILLAGLLFHLHYTAALLFSAELLFWLLARKIDPELTRYRGRDAALDAFFLAAICAPAWSNVQAIAARRHNWAEFVHVQPATAVFRIFFWGAALVFILVDGDALLRSARPAGQRLTLRQALRFELPLAAVLCWLIVPLGLAWVLTATDAARLFFGRYLVACAPAAILLAALASRLPRWPVARVALGVALIALAIVASGIVPRLRTSGRVIGSRSEDWRAAVAWLDARQLDRPAPVLLAAGLIEADALRQPHDKMLEAYCLYPLTTSLYPVHVERDMLIPLPYRRPGDLEPNVRRRVAAERGAWLVMRGRPSAANATLNQVVRSLLATGDSRASRRWRIAEQRSFGKVHVVRLTN